MDHKTNTIEQAWQEYQAKLTLFIRSKVDTTEDAEDILNDVFAALIKQNRDNQIPDKIISWLYRVTRNKIIDYYRTKKQLFELPDNLTEETTDTSTISSLSACIVPMILALPETYQQPLLLSEIEGKKYHEVADELGLSLAAVKSRILRGRDKLHKSLISCCTIHRNNTGNIIDYDQKDGNTCHDCEP